MSVDFDHERRVVVKLFGKSDELGVDIHAGHGFEEGVLVDFVESLFPVKEEEFNGVWSVCA